MSRPKNEEPSSPIHTNLPESLVREIKILLLDPKTGRVKYGAMNGLIEKLLRQYLRDIRNSN